ncbi:MAG: hypothetical protein HKN61_09025 [Flavobacteriaceae bacterium]|nr:hypothetical protein [Flavobacteriaceae bacterium]
MLKPSYQLITIFAILCLYTGLVTGFAQAPEVFTLKDFDLRGPVQQCIVITDYGREEYSFDKKGRLVKAITRYSDSDYDVTYYKLRDTILVEQRDEVYRDNEFDEQTSMAHFYSRDTTQGLRITEKIFSYNKEFREQNEYEFDLQRRLSRIITADQEGVDETVLSYEKSGGGQTVLYTLNDNLQKTTRTYKRPTAKGDTVKVVYTKEYQDSIPRQAKEEIYNLKGRKLIENQLSFRRSDSSLVPVSKTIYQYGDQGLLAAVITQKNGTEKKVSYIYQLDGSSHHNWIKEIITPANSYTSRKITYYKAPPATVKN